MLELYLVPASLYQHSVVNAIFITVIRNVVSVSELFSCSTEDQTQGSIHIVLFSFHPTKTTSNTLARRIVQ